MMMKVAAYVKTAWLALMALVLVISIISFPQQAFEGSLRGLTLWWEVVFPALLPFFITSELLMGFGVVHFMGVLLEPLMRPLFGVPGVGGFVLSMGLASGYPMGAKLTVRLREQKLVSRIEGERLVGLASTSGPLFMVGAVAVGFFHDARLGVIIALSHYLAALCVGLLMRYHHWRETDSREYKPYRQKVSGLLFLRALKAMHEARLKDGRAIGHLMGDAVTSSIQTLLLIGGFIIIFSVFNRLLYTVGVADLVSTLLAFIFLPLGLDATLIPAMFAGLFEITLGSQLASQAGPDVLLAHKVALACAIISFSGLSVHAQVASMLASTDIRYLPYLVARLIHAVLAGLFTLMLWNPLYSFLFEEAQPTLWQESEQNIITHVHFWTLSLILMVIVLLIIVIIISWAKFRLQGRFLRQR
jgi:sporulation integral membrane protein YlbJ